MASALLIILIVIGILVFIKNNDNFLYFFVFFYPILPEYFALKMGDSLPLLTASRCLILMMFFFTLLRTKKINFKYIKETKFSRVLIVYFIFSTINFLVHSDNPENLKEYFGIILENIILVFIVVMNINTEEKKEKCIKTIVFSAGMVFLLSAIEPFTGVNIAEFLDTGASETVLQAKYERMNMYRATFSFGHPICLAVYTIMILPIVMYCIDKYNKIIYKLIFLLNILCILLTISRGQILIAALLLVVMFIFMKKEERRKYYLLLFSSFCVLIFGCIVSEEVLNNFMNIIYSVLNAIGFNFNIVDFGTNENAMGRFDQLTMLPQVLDKYFFFGGGQNYIKNNLVYVYSATGEVYRAVSIDCEYISILIGKGVVGLFYNLYLYFSILKCTIQSKVNSKLSKVLFYSFLGAFMSYFTVNQLTTNRIFWLLLCFVIVEGYQSKNKNRRENVK